MMPGHDEEAAMKSDDAVVACSLNRDDLAARTGRWMELAARAFAEPVPTEQGLRLVFRRTEGVEDELQELARLEQQCCAFAGWAVSPDGDRVMLDVSGSSDEAVAAVRAMFRFETEAVPD
jgi:hypothetical protein